MIPGFEIDTWYPVGRSDDAPRRHIHQAALFGRELAVWRADDGAVNVWNNRCLHRGVRLTVGRNEGMELKCLYHGWRYASRSGECTYIPAHPADAPARTIANRVFPALERHGLIWTNVALDGPTVDEPDTLVDGLDVDAAFALRSLPFDAPPDLVRAALDDDPPLTGAGVRWIVQPVDRGACVVHGVLADTPPPDEHLDVWRRYAVALDRRRDEIETRAAALPTPEPIVPELERIEPSERAVPMPRARAEAELRVVVASKQTVADGVVALALAPVDGDLPAPQPGAHIDVHLPNGLVRQYSLTNRSGDGGRYVIGVKREPDSRGGSSCLHDTVREGDVLAISAPRNNFTLRRDAVQTVLIAGGIGLTPLLSMAETLRADGHGFRLHVFARSNAHVAFADRLAALGDAVVTHLGLTPDETAARLTDVLTDPPADARVYICGPGPMLDAARERAAAAGWPDTAIHFEYFRNDTPIDDTTAFTVSLARSGVTLEVPAGATLLDVLREHGVPLSSSCEQGACGTCVVGVVDGDPLHQDVYLSPGEREAGERIATCVSRARSDHLILDL